jgi:hypothetical protein
MRFTRITNVAALVGGVIMGPWALRSAEAATPQLNWAAVEIAFVGSMVAVVLAIAFQALLRNTGGVRSGLRNMATAGLFFAASGLSALVAAAYRGAVGPSACFIAAIGFGVLIGAGINRVAFRGAFAT